jgi:glycosyltransferase involved in cell wall biosynthesis
VRRVTVAQGISPTQAASADSARSPLDMLRLTRAVMREPLDVFFSPSVYTYFPLPPGLRALVCIHDCIAERYPELTLPSKRARMFWNAKVKLALWQARLVLTVSDYSARDLASVLGVPPAKIRVSTEAPAPAFVPSASQRDIEAAAQRIGLPPGARWFVYVGGFNPHKHVDLIVRAHATLAAESATPPHLLLVGSVDRDVFHGDQFRIRKTIHDTRTDALVHWTGFVPDQELRHLHSGSIALLLPSQCEGFGLPAVEAAACGAPVIATVNSPLPELLAGGGLFVEPGDEAALTAAMRRVLADETTRKQLGNQALERARSMTWPRGAQAALDACRECARETAR